MKMMCLTVSKRWRIWLTCERNSSPAMRAKAPESFTTYACSSGCRRMFIGTTAMPAWIGARIASSPFRAVGYEQGHAVAGLPAQGEEGPREAADSCRRLAKRHDPSRIHPGWAVRVSLSGASQEAARIHSRLIKYLIVDNGGYSSHNPTEGQRRIGRWTLESWRKTSLTSTMLSLKAFTSCKRTVPTRLDKQS